MGSTPLWQPDQNRKTNSVMTRFQKLIEEQYDTTFPDYQALWQWSIDNPARFWGEIWQFADIRSEQQAALPLKEGKGIRDAIWFDGARLNFAENLLRRTDDAAAIIFRGEDGQRSALSYKQLYSQVARLSETLRARGIQPGDRVAGYMPNLPETIVAMLATTSIGAIWTSCSPDFGINGVVDRFGQVKPRVLITVDGYRYNGKEIDNLDKLEPVLQQIPEIELLILVPFLNSSDIPDTYLLWDDALNNTAEQITFAQLPFDHPLYVMYSSGTTGVPKCIVHGAGGTLIQHLKEHLLHTGMGNAERMLYFTTCGWMMWNWMVSALATGASLVLFDGSPFYPGPEALWQIVEEEKVTVFGTSAKYISAVESAELIPKQHWQLRQLKTLLSTGSPLSPESFEFIYQQVKTDLHLASISGGTDIISCFALGNPNLPVYAGELQCRGLGMAVEVYDDQGNSVSGQKGELVCTRPFPSRPIGFWNDPDGARYHDAYFARFKGIWAHGDYAELTERNGLIIHGRSDAVLNPGGVRIGTAEIYRQVEKVDAVLDSVCIGQPWEGDTRVILFVMLKPGFQMNHYLEQEIRSTIRSNTTPRHVPSLIIQVPDIPRTKSGKIVELAVRNRVMGEPVKNTESLANPEALEYFRPLG